MKWILFPSSLFYVLYCLTLYFANSVKNCLTPSNTLLCKRDSTCFTDNGDLNLSWIGHLILNLLGNVS